jgi:hypothetical protein
MWMRNLGTLLLGACLSLFAGLALAATPTASLSWTGVTLDTGGNAITGITYNVYQGTQGAALVKVQSALAAVAATVTAGLTQGTTQCFAVTAVANGVESAQSTTACAAIPFPTPGVPTQITVVIH